MSSFVVLCVFLAIGHWLRTNIALFQRLYLPSCVIGGVLALFFVQMGELLGQTRTITEYTLFMGEISRPWRQLPGLLICVVFACLFLGVSLPRLSEIWKRSSTQLVYGQIVAWGQYVVGIGLCILVLMRFFPDLNPMFSGILPVGFEGGHGTAAGMGHVFALHGWPQGQDLALSSATFGIVSAIIVGTILVNWAVRKGHVQHAPVNAFDRGNPATGIIPIAKRQEAGKLTVNSDAIDSLTLHLVVVALAIGLGMLLKMGLVRLEGYVPYLKKHGLLSSFPLFPLCMLGGILIQWFEVRFDSHRLIDLGLIRRIQNCALDFLVVAAIATIRIWVVADAMVPLLILVAAGILWNVFCVMCLARYILKDAWFERAIAEMGQSMGVTATGLLLLRTVDPDCKTSAADAFACKQILHGPFMGGGLWTSMAIAMIAIYGPHRVLYIALVAMAIWLSVSVVIWLMPGK